MNLARLTRGDAIAAIAALALLLAMSLDWYGTHLGDDARRIEGLVGPGSGRPEGQVAHTIKNAARFEAEAAEKTAWQAYGVTDIVLLAAFLAAIAAGLLRAAGRRFTPPATPSAVAAALGAAGALMVSYQLVDRPGDNAITTVKPGAFLGLICVVVLALGALTALRAEQDGRAFVEPDPESEPAVASEPGPP